MQSIAVRYQTLSARLDPFLVLALVSTGFLILPLLPPGLPPTDDGYLHLLRPVELHECIRQGVLYPRWAPDFWVGYGYPFFNFYAPMVYYLVEAFHLVGFDFIVALKLTIFLGIELAALHSFLLGRELWGSKGGFVSAVAFVYIPHLVTETLHRGDYAQMFAIALLPAILFYYHRLVQRGGLAYFVASVVSLAALVLTHNVTTMLFGPFLLAYVGFLIVNGRRLQRVPLATAAIALAFLITAFFWLPALCERQHVRTENLLQGDFDFRNHFLSWSSLLSPPAIHDIRRANPERVYSLGPAHVSLAILGLLSACTARGRLKNRSRLVALYLAMTGGAVLLMLPLSQPVWEMLPLLALAQFPWRFLSIAGLGLSLIAGGAVALVSDRGPFSPAWLATLGSVSIIIICAAPQLYPSQPFHTKTTLSPRDIVEFEERSGAKGTSSGAEFLPRWVADEPDTTSALLAYQQKGTTDKVDVSSLPTGVAIWNVNHSPNLNSFEFSASQTTEVVFRIFYFPGWNAYVDGRSVSTRPAERSGLVAVSIPPGSGQLTLRFEDTPIRTFANLISLASTFALVAGTVLARRRLYRWHDSFESQFGHSPADSMAPPESLWRPAGLLGLMLIAGLAGKALYIDPSTALFRTVSPPHTVAGLSHPVNANFGNNFTLLGYDLGSTGVPSGEDAHLTLYWQAHQSVSDDHSVFVHLHPSGGDQRLVQSDHFHPGRLPTRLWTPDKYVADHHTIRIPAWTPPGVYDILVGIYRRNGERLPLIVDNQSSGQESLRIGQLRIQPAPEARLPYILREAAADGLPVSYPLQAVFGGELSLLDFSNTDQLVSPDHPLQFSLLWHAEQKPSGNIHTHLRLIDKSGKVISEQEAPLVPTDYPTTLWRTGETLLGIYSLPLPSNISSGEYDILVALARDGDGEDLTVTGSATIIAEKAVLLPGPKVKARDRLMEAPLPTTSTYACFGDLAELIGYDLSVQRSPSSSRIQLTLYWRALRTADKDFTVFTHLLDKSGKVIAQDDSQPCRAKCRTTSWIAGEYLLDNYQLSYPDGTLPKDSIIEIGMYDAVSGSRLPVFDSLGKQIGDHLILQTADY